MQSNSFLPAAEAPFNTWLQTFDSNIDAYASVLNITADMLAALKAEVSSTSASIDEVVSTRATLASNVAAKNTAVASVSRLLRDQAAIFKKQPGYTDAIGQALGIIPPSIPFDPSTYQAEILSAVNIAAGGVVRLRFSKARGYINGINLYCRLQGQAAFGLIGFRQKTPFVDETPLAQPNTAEIREYQAVAVIGDVEIGVASNIVSLAVR